MASNVNQHKRMAMGEKVTGMKKGGVVRRPRGGGAMLAPSPVAPVGPPAPMGQMPPGGQDLSQATMRRGGKVKDKDRDDMRRGGKVVDRDNDGMRRGGRAKMGKC